MGFKIIREEKRSRKDQLHFEQLLKETKIWENLTSREEEGTNQLIERVQLVKTNRKKVQSPEELVELLSKNIKDEKVSLAQTQGNIDLERLQELLS